MTSLNWGDDMGKEFNLGTWDVDVILQEDGKYNVWISHAGNSGYHFKNATLDEIGRNLADDIYCVAEAYVMNE